jgi:hypothetical protein
MSDSGTRVKSDRIQAAQELWERLKKDLFGAQVTIVEIIESKAWEVLGYPSFAAAWRVYMSDITLAAEVRPHVVYQMLAEGKGIDEIADAITGVGPETVRNLKRQRDNNVPAGHLVREHRRRSAQRHFLTVEVDGDTMAEWQTKAKARDATVAEIALPAVVAAFEALT